MSHAGESQLSQNMTGESEYPSGGKRAMFNPGRRKLSITIPESEYYLTQVGESQLLQNQAGESEYPKQGNVGTNKPKQHAIITPGRGKCAIITPGSGYH